MMTKPPPTSYRARPSLGEEDVLWADRNLSMESSW
jgi:hypothetical protein